MNKIKARPPISELEAILNAPSPPKVWIRLDGTISECDPDLPQIAWPDPTLEMLDDPKFKAIWQCIKRWDINVPNAYGGYCGATGNHVRAILDALNVIENTTVTFQHQPK